VTDIFNLKMLAKLAVVALALLATVAAAVRTSSFTTPFYQIVQIACFFSYSKRKPAA